MIKPALQGDAFLDDVRAAASDLGALHLWWLGQSGFLIQWHQRHLLLDPYLSDSLTHKYAATDKPHVRMTERVIAPERLDFIDVVTSSHNHTDHLDEATLIPLIRANPKIQLVIPEANREAVCDRLRIPQESPAGLNAGQSKTIAGFEIYGVPAAHPTLQKDDRGRHHFLGYIIHAGPWTIYHAGDTKLYDLMENWLSNGPIDVAMLPINGDIAERRVAGNLTGAQAATLAHRLHMGLVIPCHFDMFEFNTVTPDEFVSTATWLGQPYRLLRAGERCTIRREIAKGDYPASV